MAAKPSRTATPADALIETAQPMENVVEAQTAPSDIVNVVEETLEGLQAAVEEQAPADKETTVVTTCRLLEPHLFIRFAAGVPVTVPKLTNWMRAQIDAGLMKEV